MYRGLIILRNIYIYYQKVCEWKLIVNRQVNSLVSFCWEYIGYFKINCEKKCIFTGWFELFGELLMCFQYIDKL